MRSFKFTSILVLIIVVLFSACSKKDGVIRPDSKPVDTTSKPRPDTTIKVRVQAFVEIGAAVYDTLAASLAITSWDSSNVAHQQQVAMKSGTNEISLHKKYVRHKFEMSQWGVKAAKEFTREELTGSQIIRLGGNKDPKRIKSESSYRFVQGQYIIQGRTDYFYHSNGSIDRIEYYGNRPHMQGIFLTWIDHFRYNAGKVVRIDRHNEGDEPKIATTFLYGSGGKVSHIHVKGFGQENGAAVLYSVESGKEVIDIDYVFSNGQSLSYNMKFLGNNKIEESGSSSTGAGEGGTFRYDQNVNPYFHMNWPDMYLSNSSKNNRVEENKQYRGSIPSAVPSEMLYQYDEDGYPTQLIKKFKAYQTNQHLYETKTVYQY